jgi:hypothetical protein
MVADECEGPPIVGGEPEVELEVAQRVLVFGVQERCLAANVKHVMKFLKQQPTPAENSSSNTTTLHNVIFYIRESYP